MVLNLPIRTKTRIDAGFVTHVRKRTATRRRGHKRRHRTVVRERTSPSARVRYGGRARLVGMLRTEAGRSLPRAPIELLVRRVGDADYRSFARTTTDTGGLFNFPVPPGPSRDLRVRYAGTRTALPATALAKLAVRGRATLKLIPRRLNNGDILLFAGRVRAAGATIPSRGKLVQVQFRDGRRWRPAVRLARTDRDGRFRITYRFRRISSPTRITFRILVPAEDGWGYETGTSPRRFVDVYP